MEKRFKGFEYKKGRIFRRGITVFGRVCSGWTWGDFNTEELIEELRKIVSGLKNSKNFKNFTFAT